MSIRAVFIDAIRECKNIPLSVRDAAATVLGVRQSTFDSSYLIFLDEQIELNARGEEWSQRLRKRKSGLAQWCDVPLIDGKVEVGTDDYSVYVDPESQSVVYWEHYADVRCPLGE